MVLETYCYGVEKTDEGKREFMYSGKIISTLKKSDESYIGIFNRYESRFI